MAIPQGYKGLIVISLVSLQKSLGHLISCLCVEKVQVLKMIRIRNDAWETDDTLHHDLRNYVAENLRRAEILDFVKRDYPDYAWSLGTLSRRLAYFDIKYVDYEVTVGQVEQAFLEENSGPGQLLGYRAMHKKLRQEHNLQVPRGLVYDTMTRIDPEGLDRRRCAGQAKKKKRGPTGTFTSLVWSWYFYT